MCVLELIHFFLRSDSMSTAENYNDFCGGDTDRHPTI